MLLILLLLLVSGCVQKKKVTYSLIPHCRTNRPYKILNKVYIPQPYYDLKQIGMASYYGGKDGCHGRKTATGDVFYSHLDTAAHKTLPIPCIVKVTNRKNGKSIKLKVNDRGPFAKNRIIDVSESAAKRLGFHHEGHTLVEVETLVDETVEMITGRKVKKKFYVKVWNASHTAYKIVVKVILFPFKIRNLFKRK